MKYKENPFVGELKVGVIWKGHMNKVYGEGDNGSVYSRVDRMDMMVETTRYCKVFCEPNRRLRIGALSTASKCLLLWLFYDCVSSKDYVVINAERYMAENDVSRNTYKKGLEGLINEGVLAERDGVGYWINPEYFYKGNRINKFKDNLNVKGAK